MPYVNKRNRYIAAAKSFAENNRPTSPGRIARNEPASYSRGAKMYDMSALIAASTAASV